MSNEIRIAGNLLLTLVLLFSMSVTAFAYPRIDVTEDTSLTLEYVDGSTPISGADFRLYRVADISGTNRYTLAGDFATYQVSLEDLDSAGWLDLAATLASYAARDKLDPLAEGATNSAGSLTFNDLSVGLYLVAGDPITIGNYTYTPTPFLVSLPSLDTSDKWVYNVTSEVKFEKNDHGGGDDTTRRTVVKVWKGDDGENRPKSVTVQLLRNGQVYDEVTLSEKNNWRYTWTGLSGGSTWQLTEKTVPDGYTVSVSRNGLTFTVTNTYTPPDPTPTPSGDPTPTPSGDPTPTPSGDPTPTPSGDPTPTPSGDPTPTPSPSEPPDIPQTGQLWWPIPLLAGCGLALFAVGWGLVFLKRKRDE